MSVYDRPTDPAKRRSAKLTDGVDRAPARAMLKGVGFTDDDLAKPLIGDRFVRADDLKARLKLSRQVDGVTERGRRGVRSVGTDQDRAEHWPTLSRSQASFVIAITIPASTNTTIAA